MKTELSFAPFAEMKTELLAVLAVDTQTSKDSDAKPFPELLTADKAILAAAEAVLASGEFKAAAHETLLLHAPAGLAAKRLLLVGLGKQAKATVNSVRQAPRHPRTGFRPAACRADSCRKRHARRRRRRFCGRF